MEQEIKLSKNNRVKNTSRNILWGLLNGLVSVFLPFITRAVILYLLGAAYLGIGTLFTSVLQFLGLTELGLGSAVVYTMYRPIAENDTEEICRILNYFRKMYRTIGIGMLTVGTLIVPAVPFLIHGESPAGINIYILYYLYLINSVIGYFFAGYRESILTAHQRKDIAVRCVMLVSVLVQILQIAVLVSTKNFYAYAFVPIAGTVITNILYAFFTKRMYPELCPRGMISAEERKEIGKNLSGLVGTKLSSIVLHSSDAIVISAFLGLTLTAQYGNYYFLMEAICGFIATLFTAMTASIGDKLVRDSLEENYRLFQHISFANNWLVSWCTISFVCMIESVIRLVYGESMLLGWKFSIFMGVYLYIYQIQKTILTYKDASGIWYSDRFRPYVVMTTNLISNLILVNVIGIYGIVLSTIISFLISLPWINRTLFTKLFHISPYINLLNIMKNAVFTIVLCLITYCLCRPLNNGPGGLAGRMVICGAVPNILWIAAYRKSQDLEYWKQFIKKMLHLPA